MISNIIKKIRHFLLWEIGYDLLYVFLNNFICYIPIWLIRKWIYKLCGMKIGRHSRILMKTVIVDPWKISIGNRTFINENCFLDGRCGIEIGDDVTVAIYSKLISGGHDINDDNFSFKGDKIIIGNNVAIFADTVVLAGSLIEDKSVICAKALVTKGKYEGTAVYAGVPAKYIKMRQCEKQYKQDGWQPIFR